MTSPKVQGLMSGTKPRPQHDQPGVNRPMATESGGEKKMTCEPHQVMVCVKCKKSTLWVNGQMYDVTERIDLKAWEKTEKEAHAATGPGGQC
jgi:hypothetical protein